MTRSQVLPKRIIVGRWVMAPEDYAFELFSLSIRLYFWPGSHLYDRHFKRSWKTRPSISFPPFHHSMGNQLWMEEENVVFGLEFALNERLTRGDRSSHLYYLFSRKFVFDIWRKEREEHVNVYYYALVISPFSWRAFKYLTEIKTPKTIRKDWSFILDGFENFFSIARCVGYGKISRILLTSRYF